MLAITQMAIYLDSNVLYAWRTFTELDRVAVSIVSQQIRQTILVPWIVYEEASANYHRGLVDAAKRLESAVDDVNQKFDDLSEEVQFDPFPDAEFQLQKWQRRLETFATVMSHEHTEATEALRREAWRVAPARPSGANPKAHGVGGR